MNGYAVEKGRLRAVNTDTYRQAMCARQEFGECTGPARNVNEKEESFRRNGYNRKHAYDALFDDNEQGEAADGVTSIETWHDDVSAITDIQPPAGLKAKHRHARLDERAKSKDRGRGNQGERLHVFGASRFSWHDSEDEEDYSNKSSSECSDSSGKKRRTNSGKTLTTATVTTDTSESGTFTEKGPSSSPDENSRRWLNTTMFENFSERVLETPVRKRRGLGDGASFSREDYEVIDEGAGNVTESLRNLMLSPLAACFSCETRAGGQDNQKHFFEDDSHDKKIQRMQSSKKNHQKRKSLESGNKKDDHHDARIEEIPSWVVISS